MSPTATNFATLKENDSHTQQEDGDKQLTVKKVQKKASNNNTQYPAYQQSTPDRANMECSIISEGSAWR